MSRSEVPGGPPLEVRLPRRCFTAGEEVAGEVVVRADHPLPCAALQVRAWWAARSRDPSTDEIRVAADTTLREGGELEPGEVLPFRLRLPDGPPSFPGELVQIQWSVTARLRRPRLHPVTARVRITVAPPAIDDTALPELAAAWTERWRRFHRPRVLRARLRDAATTLGVGVAAALGVAGGARLWGPGLAAPPASVALPALAALGAGAVIWR